MNVFAATGKADPGRLVKAAENFLDASGVSAVFAQARAGRRDFIRSAFAAATAAASSVTAVRSAQAAGNPVPPSGGDANILALPEHSTGLEWGNVAVPTCQYSHGMLSCSEFTGVPLKLLLDMAGVDYRRARYVLAEGADGSSMTRTVPMELVERGEVSVAYGQNGEMLRPEQGYPLRLVVPGVQGVSWVKYLRRIEVGDQPCGAKDEVIHYVGGTTQDDIRIGRVARLNDAAYPGRTTLMKVSSLSTLWDYINRAMPWAQPTSLPVDDVYAVTAYILNLADVLPNHFSLSDQNMAEVQKRLPNRNGTTTDHALWPGAGMAKRRPDVKAVACMKDGAPAPLLAPFLPDFARDAHGNLADQNRPVGPSFREVAQKYGAEADGLAYLAGKIKSGGSGRWGAMPMPAQALSDADAQAIAQWLMDGARP